MTEHMKGPWQFVETTSPSGQEWLGCGVVAGDDFEFVWLDDDPETDIPTARLIAAAPDLLEALEEYLPILEFLEESGLWDDAAHGTGLATANKYRAAIARATGEKEAQE